MIKQIKIDLGKLLLRIAVGSLFLLHGIHKMLHGFDGIKIALVKNGFSEFWWFGCFVGEIIAPICIILGIFSRISALLVVVVMIFSIYLVFGASTFDLNSKGALVTEANFLFMFSALAIFFLGSGQYSLYKKETGIFA